MKSANDKYAAPAGSVGEGSNMQRILLVDDEKDLGQMISTLLAGEPYEIEHVTGGSEALARIRDEALPDLVLLDINLPDISGIDILRELKGVAREIPIVMMTACGDIETVVRCIKMGAADFLRKPFNPYEFRKFIRDIISVRSSSSRENCGIVGTSPGIRRVLRLADKFALSDLTIILQGESGTGKELFARAVHQRSKRGKGPFVPLDCAALSETLIDTELFGHEKGSFTGAADRRIGRFERAHGGTLFIDEVENLSPSNQAKLLRAVEEKRIERVGGSKSIKVDVRIIAASNIPLTEIMEAGRFRRDLYYRFSQMTIEIPPLRERKGDVNILIRHFLKSYSEEFGRTANMSDEALSLLNAYSWPGNVRELENVVKSTAILADGDILAEHLPHYIGKGSFQLPGKTDGYAVPGIKVDEEIERGLREGSLDLKALVKRWSDRLEETVIRKVMERSNLNMIRVSQFLNIDPKTLRSKISQIRSDMSRDIRKGKRFPESGGDSLPFQD